MAKKKFCGHVSEGLQDPLREGGFFLSEFLSRQTKGALSSCLIFVAEAAAPRQGTALARIPQVNLVRAGRPLLQQLYCLFRNLTRISHPHLLERSGSCIISGEAAGFLKPARESRYLFLISGQHESCRLSCLAGPCLSTAGTNKEGDCFLYTPRCEQTSLLCNCIHFPQTAKAGEAGEQQPGRQLPSTGEERTLEGTTCLV